MLVNEVVINLKQIKNYSSSIVTLYSSLEMKQSSKFLLLQYSLLSSKKQLRNLRTMRTKYQINNSYATYLNFIYEHETFILNPVLMKYVWHTYTRELGTPWRHLEKLYAVLS